VWSVGDYHDECTAAKGGRIDSGQSTSAHVARGSLCQVDKPKSERLRAESEVRWIAQAVPFVGELNIHSA